LGAPGHMSPVVGLDATDEAPEQNLSDLRCNDLVRETGASANLLCYPCVNSHTVAIVQTASETDPGLNYWQITAAGFHLRVVSFNITAVVAVAFVKVERLGGMKHNAQGPRPKAQGPRPKASVLAQRKSKLVSITSWL
jgi:hypothetical protein